MQARIIEQKLLSNKKSKVGLETYYCLPAPARPGPIVLLLSQGQRSDCRGAALTLDALPPAKELLADRGYDSDWYRQALQAKGIAPCIPGRTN